MYSFEINNSLLFHNHLLDDNNEVPADIRRSFEENLENDYELLKTMYADNIEEIVKDINEDNKTLSFKIKLILEFEVNTNYYNIIKEFKIPEVCQNEFNFSTKDPDKRLLNLPYYISFYYNRKVGLRIDIFLFWVKKTSSFYEVLKNNLFNEVKDEMYFNSFFFCFIEYLKSNLLAPDKNYLLFILQEINEISLIKANKEDFFDLLKEFYFRRKKIPLADSNLIFYNLNKKESQTYNIANNNNEYNENEFDEETFENALDLKTNNFDISQMKKRSDKLLENSINKKNQSFNIKKNQNSQQEEEENSNTEYDNFIKIGGVKGDVSTDRGSSFQAHAIKLTSFDEVNKFTKMLLTHNKIQKATHNIMAYRFLGKDISEKEETRSKNVKDKNSKNISNSISEGFDDDGEAGAGTRLLGILQKMKIYNVLVVVSRWFGGTLLGNDRFKHINDTAKDLILNHKSKFDYES